MNNPQPQPEGVFVNMKTTSIWRTWRKALFKGEVLGYLWIALVILVVRVSKIEAEDYQGRIGPDVEAQLAFIGEALHGGIGTDWRTMLSHTFYGFSLVNTVLLDPENHARRSAAIEELKWILEQLEDPSLADHYLDTQVPHGVYLLGERNLTLGGLMLIDPDPDAGLAEEFDEISQILYQAFMSSPTANLETYPGATFPVDNLPALYALAIHDALYDTNYEAAISSWVDWMEANLDPQTGLMPSRIDYHTGAILGVPRGCALSLSFAFLPELAPEFAERQYTLYREQFFKTTWGFAGMREYPPGISRQADVDSGPIIMDVGAAATGIGIVAAKAMDDSTTFENILQLAEIIGFPSERGGQKSYLLGVLLIGDIIQVWGKTHTPWLKSGDFEWTPIESYSLSSFYWIALITGGALFFFSSRLVRRIQKEYIFASCSQVELSRRDHVGMVLFGAQVCALFLLWVIPITGIFWMLMASAAIALIGILIPPSPAQ